MRSTSIKRIVIARYLKKKKKDGHEKDGCHKVNLAQLLLPRYSNYWEYQGRAVSEPFAPHHRRIGHSKISLSIIKRH